MGGIGPVELIIVLLIALVLFGSPVIAFVLGYALGKKRSTETSAASPAAAPAAQTPAAPVRSDVTAVTGAEDGPSAEDDVQ